MKEQTIPFKGIVVWSISVNLHTDMVYKELSKYINVTLCTMRSEFRDYGKLNLGNIRLVKIKSLNDFPKETLSKDYLHISNAVKKVKNYNEPINACFAFAIKKGCHAMALNIEQYPWWDGIRGIFRRLQWFWIYNISAMRKIEAIGCQGEAGLFAYKKSCVKSRKLFEYIYAPSCVSINYYPPLLLSDQFHLKEYKFQFSFVGSICRRKCIIPVIKELKATDWNFQFNIVGCGDLESEMISLIGKDERFNYLGRQQVKQTHEILEHTDCLILPSSFDGWGAVVNEALLHGCRCIVSDSAGSHSLIKSTGFGQVFPSGDWRQFKEAAKSELFKGKILQSERENIKLFGKRIEPESVAVYLVNVISYYFGDSKTLPQVPWKDPM